MWGSPLTSPPGTGGAGPAPDSVGACCPCHLPAPEMENPLGMGTKGLFPELCSPSRHPVGAKLEGDAQAGGVSPSPGCLLGREQWSGNSVAVAWGRDSRSEHVKVLGLLMEWQRISSVENKNPEKNVHCCSKQSWMGFISIFCRFVLFSAPAFPSFSSCICSFYFCLLWF